MLKFIGYTIGAFLVLIILVNMCDSGDSNTYQQGKRQAKPEDSYHRESSHTDASGVDHYRYFHKDLEAIDNNNKSGLYFKVATNNHYFMISKQESSNFFQSNKLSVKIGENQPITIDDGKELDVYKIMYSKKVKGLPSIFNNIADAYTTKAPVEVTLFDKFTDTKYKYTLDSAFVRVIYDTRNFYTSRLSGSVF